MLPSLHMYAREGMPDGFYEPQRAPSASLN
jgi:hypothetical protein